jgi:hypothetical protein
MKKLSEILQQALDKKQNNHRPTSDDDVQSNKQSNAKPRTPVIGKKPPTRSAGRGR